MGYRNSRRIIDLGVGVGFRYPHYDEVLTTWPDVDWFEVISDNFFGEGGAPLARLDALRAHYPVVPHGVSMSLGSVDPLDPNYLQRLSQLLRRIDPPWFSDHLCWSGAHGVFAHDLFPLPQTEACVAHVVERIKRIQGTLERPIALETVSSYVAFASNAMPEWEFLASVAEKADCGLLFDVNNVYVSAKNHGLSAEAYVDAIPADRVVQIHLAGHTDKGTHLLDTHSDHVNDDVWDLYRRTLRRTGPVATLIEWDEDIPAWSVLYEEARKARAVRDEVFAADALAGQP